MAERSADLTISVSCRQLHAAGWSCDVVVAGVRSQTSHVVSVSQAELSRYAGSSTDVEAFVADAFRFLLERESKESILRRLAIGDIERYFPEFGDRPRAS